MDHPEEEMILDDDEDKYDDIIDEEEVDCSGVRKLIRESRPLERLEPQWDNNKSYLKSIKEKIFTFEDDMLNTKTDMNNNLFTQKIEKSKSIE